MENIVYDLVIVGSGPAGLTSAIYAERAMLKTILLEKNSMSGGQVINTYEVDNYPALPGINGFDLSIKMREHAEELGATIRSEEVVSMELNSEIKTVNTNEAAYKTKTVILATGAYWRKLGVSGEEKFSGLGVSYCATCDGAFFKNKEVAVVGGGDVAVEDAIFLARLCKKVYLIHRRDELRAVKVLQDKLFNLDNVEILWDSVVEKIDGEQQVNNIIVKNLKLGEEKTISLDGIFIAIGTLPNSDILKDYVKTDTQGYILADETCKTSLEGVFAVGDVRKKPLRQIITAAADGAVGVYSAEQYIVEKF